ncbi:MAG: 3-phosphoglycerate dehydrogenase [Bacillota bacterium]|nr:MAG: 3-phosphoglycerate dehydrogenase [Bacillota bacterium]
MHRIHCLNSISKVGLNTLHKPYELTDHIHEASAILVRSAQMHELNLPKSVLAVARAGAGVNNIPLEKYANEGVVCFNTPGANANAVKELIICGMLLASRDVYGGIAWIRDHKDDQEIGKTVEKIKTQFGGTEILGKTIGIIGLGAIGVELAKSCHALGMKVVGHDRYLDPIRKADLPSDTILCDTKEELFPLCDFISINVPLLSETKGMLNESAFNMMRDGVIILNFARDALVNDADLEKAIASHKVRKYVTDFPNQKTVNMEGVIAIPHLGASTEEAEDNCAIMAIDQLKKYIETGSIINSVNYPNLHVKRELRHIRLQILFKSEEDHADAMIKQIKAVAVNLSNIEFAYKHTFGYAIVDFDESINDHIIEKLMLINGVIRVIKIQI